MVQKGLKMHEKRQQIEFLDLNYLFLAEFSLVELGGTPLLTEKNTLGSILWLPYTSVIISWHISSSSCKNFFHGLLPSPLFGKFF